MNADTEIRNHRPETKYLTTETSMKTKVKQHFSIASKELDFCFHRCLGGKEMEKQREKQGATHFAGPVFL